MSRLPSFFRAALVAFGWLAFQVLGSQDYEFLQSLEEDKRKAREKACQEEEEVNPPVCPQSNFEPLVRVLHTSHRPSTRSLFLNCCFLLNAPNEACCRAHYPLNECLHLGRFHVLAAVSLSLSLSRSLSLFS